MSNEVLKLIFIALIYFCVCGGIGYGYSALLTHYHIDLSFINAIPMLIFVFAGGVVIRKLWFKK